MGHDDITTNPDNSSPAGATRRGGRASRAGTMLLLVVAILGGALAVGGSPASAAPRVDGYCQSYNGGVFSAGTDADHAIFMAVERRTSTGWKLVGYSQGGDWGGWEWRSTQVTRDLWGRKFGAGTYRITAWTYNLNNGSMVGHAPHRVVHWNNSGGYSWSTPTNRADCRITLP